MPASIPPFKSWGNKLAKKAPKKYQSDEKFNIVRQVNFDTTHPHGITFEEDGRTVKAIAPGSRSDDQNVRVGWKAFKLEADGVTRTSKFQEFLNTANQPYTVTFGVPGDIHSLSNTPRSLEEEKKEERQIIHVHVRFLVTRLSNCDIPQETFEADLF